MQYLVMLGVSSRKAGESTGSWGASWVSVIADSPEEAGDMARRVETEKAEGRYERFEAKVCEVREAELAPCPGCGGPNVTCGIVWGSRGRDFLSEEGGDKTENARFRLTCHDCGYSDEQFSCVQAPGTFLRCPFCDKIADWHPHAH